ncbi:serine/threonine-protein kinase [Actinotalea sp. Marseille-Q4924]|uniref:serine/threonine-protein kinase n=1 Tax=Actinotalea sp. Marseille-Q4924 TaxID=2866571 RepID=UPI001CE459C3|nr:serine/threonine-protein kinase [Actinotalea sp. Marseille-Q4924]
MTPGPVDVAHGVVLDGRYRIEDVVGQGGMATVYRAHDEALGRDVAVKLFPPTPDSDEVLRHQAEIKVLSQMNHPGLVALHDAGSAYAGGPLQQTYIVMELVPGPTLADLLATGPLTSTHTARIGRQLAEAIATVHAADVVHRDIKPANILLVERASAVREAPDAALTTGPIVKLADFGIARFADGARLTMTGTTLGTATYLSPEQATGAGAGPPTDVYALGLVLLECLTGRRAFTGTVAEVAAARLTTDPPIPPDVGPEWTALLQGMTAREPEARLTMVEAARRLGALAGAGRGTGAAEQAVLLAPAAPGIVVPGDADGTAPHRMGTDTGPAAMHATHAPAPSRRDRRAAAGTVQRPGRTDHDPDATGRTQPIPLVPASVPPATARGRAGARARQTVRRRWAILVAVAVVLLASVALVIGLAAGDRGASEPPPYPAVEGELGEVLEDLQRSVEP